MPWSATSYQVFTNSSIPAFGQISGHLLFFYVLKSCLFLYYAYGYLVSMHVCMYNVQRGPLSAILDPGRSVRSTETLFNLPMVVSLHVGIRDWTQDLCKSSWCSQPLSHLSSSRPHLLIIVAMLINQVWPIKVKKPDRSCSTTYRPLAHATDAVGSLLKAWIQSCRKVSSLSVRALETTPVRAFHKC